MMLGLRCGSRCIALLIGLAIVLVSGILIQRACSRSPEGYRRVTVVDPVERYDPNTRYEIPLPPQWKPTDRTIDDVPVVEPADERTRRKVEQAFGEEAEKIDFLLVGEIGRVRYGADVYVDRPKMSEVTTTPDDGVDFGDLPRARAEPAPLRFTLIPKPAPWLDLRSLHRVETWRQWESETLVDARWEASYRPWELWVKGRLYGFVDVGASHVSGETGGYVRTGVGMCIGGDC